MATRRVRPSKATQLMHTYLFHRDNESREKRDKGKVSKNLRAHVEDSGVEVKEGPRAGNIEWRTPPITINGKVYYGMELRKQTPIDFDVDAAKELAADKGFFLEACSPVLTILGHKDSDDYWAKLNTLIDYLDDNGFITSVEYSPVDQDVFFAKQQRGTISEAEVDALLVEGEPKYELWPLTEPDVEDDDG